MSDRLTAVEAAARLGVKRETLYAYVSRGLLDRTLSLDGRTSLFNARQVDELRSSRRRPARGELQTVITTSITELDETGHRYRGVHIEALIDRSFESVADHVWGQGEGSWSPPEGLREAVAATARTLPPSTPPVDRLRVAIAVASGLDPLRHNPAPSAQAAAGRSMIAASSLSLATQATHPTTSSVAETCAAALRSEETAVRMPLASATKAVDRALVLLADHGLAASTFSARIAASVRADPYSIVAAGMGPVGGALHGAASLGVHQLFLAAADVGVAEALGQHLATGQRCPGVGHTVYVDVDPREVLLRSVIEELWRGQAELDVVLAMRAAMQERVELVTNIDFALGALTWLMGAPPWAGEVLFAIARTVGWIAHGIEEFEEKPVRFRPTARYVPSADPDTLMIL